MTEEHVTYCTLILACSIAQSARQQVKRGRSEKSRIGLMPTSRVYNKFGEQDAAAGSGRLVTTLRRFGQQTPG